MASVALAAATAALLLTRHSLLAGASALASAAALILPDARSQHEPDGRDVESPRALRLRFGVRLASVLFDASILLPLAWLERQSSPRVSVVAMVGFGAAYLVAYELARGQGVGYRGWESVAYRIVTAALLVGAVFGARFDRVLLEAPLWAFAILSIAAAAKRALDVAAEERATVTSAGTPP